MGISENVIMDNEWRHAGYDHGITGGMYDENPYPEGSERYVMWDAGCMEGRAEYQEDSNGCAIPREPAEFDPDSDPRIRNLEFGGVYF